MVFQGMVTTYHIETRQPNSRLTPRAIPLNTHPTGLLIAIYLHAGQSFTLLETMGKYRLCFTQGENWDDRAKRFTSNAVFACSEEYLQVPFPVPKPIKVSIPLSLSKSGMHSFNQISESTFPSLQR